jgi:hypothetical protein
MEKYYCVAFNYSHELYAHKGEKDAEEEATAGLSTTAPSDLFVDWCRTIMHHCLEKVDFCLVRRFGNKIVL